MKNNQIDKILVDFQEDIFKRQNRKTLSVLDLGEIYRNKILSWHKAQIIKMCEELRLGIPKDRWDRDHAELYNQALDDVILTVKNE